MQSNPTSFQSNGVRSNPIQEEAEEAASKCGVTLSSLEGDAAEVDALKQGLDRRHRQAEKEAAELAERDQELAR